MKTGAIWLGNYQWDRKNCGAGRRGSDSRIAGEAVEPENSRRGPVEGGGTVPGALQRLRADVCGGKDGGGGGFEYQRFHRGTA